MGSVVFFGIVTGILHFCYRNARTRNSQEFFYGAQFIATGFFIFFALLVVFAVALG